MNRCVWHPVGGDDGLGMATLNRLRNLGCKSRQVRIMLDGLESHHHAHIFATECRRSPSPAFREMVRRIILPEEQLNTNIPKLQQ